MQRPRARRVLCVLLHHLRVRAGGLLLRRGEQLARAHVLRCGLLRTHGRRIRVRVLRGRVHVQFRVLLPRGFHLNGMRCVPERILLRWRKQPEHAMCPRVSRRVARDGGHPRGSHDFCARSHVRARGRRYWGSTGLFMPQCSQKCTCAAGAQCAGGNAQSFCNACPLGAWCAGGGIVAVSCPAAPGYYCPVSSTTSGGSPCPIGYFCTGGAAVPVTCGPGCVCGAWRGRAGCDGAVWCARACARAQPLRDCGGPVNLRMQRGVRLLCWLLLPGVVQCLHRSVCAWRCTSEPQRAAPC